MMTSISGKELPSNSDSQQPFPFDVLVQIRNSSFEYDCETTHFLEYDLDINPQAKNMKVYWPFGDSDFDILFQKINDENLQELRACFEDFFSKKSCSVNYRILFDPPKIDKVTTEKHDVQQEIQYLTLSSLTNNKDANVSLNENALYSLQKLVQKYNNMVYNRSLSVHLIDRMRDMVELLKKTYEENCKSYFYAKLIILIDEYFNQQNEASTTVFEKPSANLFFDGSISKIGLFYSKLIAFLESRYFVGKNFIEDNFLEDWKFFLVINHRPDAHSTHYQFSYFDDKTKKEAHFVQMTMGLEAMSDFQSALPLIVHEIGHYLPFIGFVEEYNKLVIQIIASCISQYITYEMFSLEEPNIVINKKYSGVFEIINKLEKDLTNAFFKRIWDDVNYYTWKMNRIDDAEAEKLFRLSLSWLLGEIDIDFKDTWILITLEWGDLLETRRKLENDLERIHKLCDSDDKRKELDLLKGAIKKYEKGTLEREDLYEKFQSYKEAKRGSIYYSLEENLHNHIEVVETKRNEVLRFWADEDGITSIICNHVDKFIDQIEKSQTEKSQTEKEGTDAFLILKDLLYPLQSVGALEIVKGNHKFFKQIIRKLLSIEAKSFIGGEIKQWMSTYKEVIADYFMIKVINLEKDEYLKIIDKPLGDNKRGNYDHTLRKNIVIDLAYPKNGNNEKTVEGQASSKGEEKPNNIELSGEKEVDLKKFLRIKLDNDITKLKFDDSKDTSNILNFIRKWWSTNRVINKDRVSKTKMLRQVVYSSEAEIDEKDSD